MSLPPFATVRLVPPPYDAAAHATVVADVHEALLHGTSSSSETVALGSIDAKFRPPTVTVAPPVCAAFVPQVKETTGAAQSRNRARCVPLP
jgi:hypothetical protein